MMLLKKNSSPLQVGQLLDWARTELAVLGPGEAKASAERLLEEVLGLERALLYTKKESVPQKHASRYRGLVLKRKTRIPAAYLLKKAYFWDEVLEVQPGCLIPRPETEILVDSFIRHSGFQKQSVFSFLDLGCGTGAIGLALLRYFPNSFGTFLDLSRKALGVTRRNLKRYGLLKRAEIVKSDLFKKFRRSAAGKPRIWDAILSNPPYVAGKDWAKLEPELGFEPRLALDGGQDGLFFYREISREAKNFLVRNGRLVFEMGEGQANAIGDIVSINGYTQQKVFKDYLGIERVLMARAAK